ncbi:uncharacterized protein BO80DRAFT_40555 [Aspergillus ibericus CBS 121593]|uniref:Uncharacterized protein n=1 Tax=Aspergillus ibericus CBS 121593 TaxID=1448316 RepID=A0A395H3W6_9EURO|nr:hypothetical protein BO80DRAFT_40555 [Aspergillus ibericus CBS 121593]RAL02139.1 hypothetical protein BO80DRAFT_40555 [Aspergillus ibericus CBS 121593]
MKHIRGSLRFKKSQNHMVCMCCYTSKLRARWPDWPVPSPICSLLTGWYGFLFSFLPAVHFFFLDIIFTWHDRRHHYHCPYTIIAGSQASGFMLFSLHPCFVPVVAERICSCLCHISRRSGLGNGFGCRCWNLHTIEKEEEKKRSKVLISFSVVCFHRSYSERLFSWGKSGCLGQACNSLDLTTYIYSLLKCLEM